MISYKRTRPLLYIAPNQTIRQTIGFALTMFVCCNPLLSGEPVKGFSPISQNKIFEQDSKWTPIWEQGAFTEGPAVAPDGSVFFSDIRNQKIMKFDPTTRKTSVFRDPSRRSNGIYIDGHGDMFVCEGATVGGARQLSVTTRNGRDKVVVDNFKGKKLNSPNDLFVCQSGNIFFTDPRYSGDEPLELDFQGVFRIAKDGSIQVATKELTRPNGILVNANESKAFVAENHPSEDKHFVTFDIDTKGRFSNKKILFDFGKERGIDGMAFGPDGNIYATAGSDKHSGIYVFSRTGKQLAFQSTPGPPTNCTFGKGKLSKRLYLTSATGKPDKKYGLYFLDVK